MAGAAGGDDDEVGAVGSHHRCGELDLVPDLDPRQPPHLGDRPIGPDHPGHQATAGLTDDGAPIRAAPGRMRLGRCRRGREVDPAPWGVEPVGEPDRRPHGHGSRP
jgi:hypothetical protein